MASPDTAMKRFWLLNILRLAGLALVLLGIAALGERIDLPRPAAALLLAAGVGVFFILPMMVARRWKAGK